jgi:RNA polymerase sigma factor (sigma-70 family)
MTTEDSVLLQRFVATRDEAAMAELVQRYLNLVYFAALRQLGGDVHRAKDVAQSVFILLAQKAATLAQHQALAGWLYTTTRYAVSETLRTERRRLAREQEAHSMHELSQDPSATADWEQLRPVIDDALNQLSDTDREAVLLRFFAHQPLTEIGAKLQVSDNAARMRVDRALDKLHALLAQRGVTSTASALALLLANQATASAPAGLAASVTHAVLAGSAVAAGGGVLVAAKTLTFMSTSKVLIGITSALVLSATAITWQQRQANTELHREIAALRQETDTQLAGLRAENERILAEKKAGEASATAEHVELLQLRAAREAFRQRTAKAAAVASVPAPAATSAAPDGTLQPGMVSVDVLQNVGRATPRAAAQTMMSAAQHGDTELAASCLAFEPAERAKLETFLAALPDDVRAKYGTPEQLMAAVISGSPKPIAGVQLLSETQPDADTAVQTVQIQYASGEVRQDEVKFHRDATGWKEVVSTATVDRVIAYFQGKTK